MYNLKLKQYEAETLIHRAIDLDRMIVCQIESLTRHNPSHKAGVSMALVSIMDRVKANEQLLRQLHRTMPSSSSSVTTRGEVQPGIGLTAEERDGSPP
jgi:hypothetical protein